MSQDTIRVAARITGLVQGVFYRGSTQEAARGRGLVGWVRNTEDGAVELEAEGPRPQVEALLRWCESGPPAAEVDRVEHSEIEARGDERSFRVAR